MCCQGRFLDNELGGNSREQQSCVTSISLASLEEETTTKVPFDGE
jgi:hypothetical protein